MEVAEGKYSRKKRETIASAIRIVKHKIILITSGENI